MTSKQLELVGIAEIAKLAGVSRQLVYQWTRRSRDMPKPLAKLACGPIWNGAEIRSWLVDIGFTHLQR